MDKKLPIARKLGKKIVSDEDNMRMDAYFGKCKQQDDFSLKNHYLKSEKSTKLKLVYETDLLSNEVCSQSLKQPIPIVISDSKHGKSTPTKSQLALNIASLQDDGISKVVNLSSQQQSASIFSQKQTQNMISSQNISQLLEKSVHLSQSNFSSKNF